jgi:HEAT repeat protein
VKVALKRHGFPSQKALALELGISRSTTDKFFTGKSVDYSFFVEISERLGLDWHAIAYIEQEPPIQVESPPLPDTPSPPKPIEFNWRQVCQDMLEAQNQRRLTTNPLTAGDGVAFELDEIYVPLGLVERKQQRRVGSDVSPEQGSRIYEPEIADEITKTFQQDEFFQQVLRSGRSRRIAIIGEPGAGKTTLLQKIAAWVLNNTEDVPIWISLADLQEKTLEQFLLEDWLKAATRKVRVTEAIQDALGELFNSKRVWLLLDAVDEMAVGATTGGLPLQLIANQITGWVADARVVLTCRLNVWDAGKNALEAFETYRNLDFSYGDAQTPDRVGQFIRCWFKSKPELAERLRTDLDQPGKERIKDTVKNPLRLALLCRSWALGQGELPNTKAGLYQQFTAALYEWKQDRFPTTSSQRQELNQALGELAKRAISEEKTKFRLQHRLVCEVLGKPDTELFQLALQLGWLNQVGVSVEAENRGEKVYAFYHPTFQEYFAAQAISDTHYFLFRASNPAQGIYRIFEPQWREIILLWLGRKDLRQRYKKDFIWQLLTFKDGCGDANYYGFRAYLLAIAGIAELENSDDAYELLMITDRWNSSAWWEDRLRMQTTTLLWEQLLSVHRRNRKQPKWHTFFTLLERAAQGVLRETEHSRAVEILVDMLHESQDSRIHHQCLVVLGKIGIGNQDAIDVVVELLQTSQDCWTLYQCLETLKKIAVGNRKAQAVLYRLLDRIDRSQYPNCGTRDTRIYSRMYSDFWSEDKLEKISTLDFEELGRLTSATWHTLMVIEESNPDANHTLTKIHHSQDGDIYEDIVEILKLTDPSYSEIIKTMLKRLHNDRDAQSWLVNRLGEVNSISKQDAIKALSELLSNTPNSRTRWKIADCLGQIDPGNLDALNALIDLVRNNDHRSEAVWSLKKTLRDNRFSVAVSGLKDSLEDGDERCYEIIWHCAQNMTYPAFYQAWHNQLAPTQRLNLAELPHSLATAVANDQTLSPSIHLICINGSKFIDRDNPATKIYTEMVKSGCPRCEDSTPKTMQELQAYWDLLDSDKRVVLVFYENTGFSETFLDALSKFDGAICVITAQTLDNIPLQCFSSGRAIADIVEWLKQIARCDR